MSGFMLVNPLGEKSVDLPKNDQATTLLYERTGATIRFKTRNMTNHELAEVLIGIVARMEKEDREDFYNELVDYAPLLRDPKKHPDKFLSPIAATIAQRPDLAKGRR